jgi:hypothetical protein
VSLGCCDASTGKRDRFEIAVALPQVPVSAHSAGVKHCLLGEVRGVRLAFPMREFRTLRLAILPRKRWSCECVRVFWLASGGELRLLFVFRVVNLHASVGRQLCLFAGFEWIRKKPRIVCADARFGLVEMVNFTIDQVRAIMNSPKNIRVSERRVFCALLDSHREHVLFAEHVRQ